MRKTLLLLFILISFAAYSQQDPQFTNYMVNKFGINPGVAGSEETINAMMINNFRWIGKEKNMPVTLNFNAEGPITLFGRQHGIGLNILSDDIGFQRNIQVSLGYSYKVNLSIGTLGIGVSLGLFNQSYVTTWEMPDDEGMGIWTPASTDQAIPQGEVSQMSLDISSGLYLSGSRYYLGLSVLHINQAEIKYSDYAMPFYTRHYYLMGGYNIKLGNPLFELRPSFLLKTDMVSSQIDINANIIYNDKFWGGVSYRFQDAIALLVGVELFNGLRVGYAFDFPTFDSGSWGSHEVYVSYSLNLMTNRSRKYKSVRFL